jgi:HEAT repeat protein
MDQRRVLEELRASEVVRRRTAAEYLAQQGVFTEAIIPLIHAASDQDDEVQQWAASALEDMGRPDEAIADPLGMILDDPDPNRVYWAATLLGRLGERAAAFADRLGEVVGSDRPVAARQRAAWALEKIGPAAQAALPHLRRAAESDDPRLVHLAHDAIEAIGAALIAETRFDESGDRAVP